MEVGTEVHHPDKSPEVETKSNDEDGGTDKMEPEPPSEDSNEKLIQSSIEDNVPQLNDITHVEIKAG